MAVSVPMAVRPIEWMYTFCIRKRSGMRVTVHAGSCPVGESGLGFWGLHILSQFCIPKWARTYIPPLQTRPCPFVNHAWCLEDPFGSGKWYLALLPFSKSQWSLALCCYLIFAKKILQRSSLELLGACCCCEICCLTSGTRCVAPTLRSCCSCRDLLRLPVWGRWQRVTPAPEHASAWGGKPLGR